VSFSGVIACACFELLEKSDHPGPSQALAQGDQSFPADLVREVGIRVLQKKKIYQIVITGNRRIEDEAIKLVIKSKIGDLYEPARLREDLTGIYRMGYFTDGSHMSMRVSPMVFARILGPRVVRPFFFRSS
jgi:hypothetical protein